MSVPWALLQVVPSFRSSKDKNLQLQSQVVRLGRPNQRVLRALTHKLSGGTPETDGRKPFSLLSSHSKDYLDLEWDLVSPQGSHLIPITSLGCFGDSGPLMFVGTHLPVQDTTEMSP